MGKVSGSDDSPWSPSTLIHASFFVVFDAKYLLFSIICIFMFIFIIYNMFLLLHCFSFISLFFPFTGTRSKSFAFFLAILLPIISGEVVEMRRVFVMFLVHIWLQYKLWYCGFTYQPAIWLRYFLVSNDLPIVHWNWEWC